LASAAICKNGGVTPTTSVTASRNNGNPNKGSSHVTNVPPYDVDDFSSWKDRFLVYLDGLESYLLKILENGPYNDLILSHEGPSDTRDTKIAALRLKFNAFKALKGEKESNSDVEEDTRSISKFLADLNAEFRHRALLANQKRFYKRFGRVAIVENEPVVGKADARIGQCVEITMKKVKRLLSMTDGDERKHVLDYTNVDLYYVQDQRKNLLRKFNSLKQEFSSFPGDIVRSLCGRGKRKETISLKEIMFTKGGNSPSETAHGVTSNTESECDNQEPLPPFLNFQGLNPLVH
ncbi:hypothetical protein Tco_1189811, partial [Tanacetum coccineum]